jgi:hypothetical protein
MTPSFTRRSLGTAALLLACRPGSARAGEADVVAARVLPAGAGRFDFDVTILSRDTGWSRYADRFDVLAPDGTVLGSRELLHPHEDEQPFTRDLRGVSIPAGIRRVTIRAHMKGVGHDGATLEVALPGR